MEPKEFEKQYMQRLNAQQREAVYAVDGPVLLLATPGSGKTTVLVTRLGYMVLCREIDPKSILTMTYTVAATKDMKSRFAAIFGETAASGLAFRTINSVSKSVIDYFGRNHAGRAPFDLVTDEGELNRLVREICQSVNEGYPEDSEIREVRRLITYIKNMMLTEEEIEKLDSEIDRLPEIVRRYRDALRQRHLMDFDDQMAYAYTILQKYPVVLHDFQERFAYICVDEAQDTSRIQHAIIRLLASGSENLFMVGDEDQSIYGFRAAYPDALLRFESDHPGAKILLMEENYRSGEEIITTANRFVSANRYRREKSMIPTRGKAAPVHVVHAKSRAFQYEYLVHMAKRCERETAILFRNNDTALPLIDCFEQNGIPYNCRYFEDTFFSNRVVIDVLDIIRFSYDPRDEELFLRLYYKFGAAISKKSALYAIERSRSSGKPLFEELLRAPEIHGAVQDAVLDLAQNLPLIRTESAETALHRIWEAMHYGRFVEQRKLDQGKLFILGMLARGIATPLLFLEKLDKLRATVAEHQNAASNKIILSTIHSSKGLEYDCVYLADVIDGILPPKTANEAEDPDEIRQYEEERRLCYVAMTRAKNELYLFQCGESSCFVSEIMKALPTPVVDTDDVFAPFLLPQIGKRFFDAAQGGGEIVAECMDRKLVSFPDGRCELLSVEEMVSRRSRKVEYAVQAERPSAPVPSSAALKKAASERILTQLHVGGFVRHKSFGNGKILAVKDDILTVDFGQKGVRKLGLALSLQNNLLSV